MKRVAIIDLVGGVRVLVSYSTVVAAWVPGRGYIVTSEWYSATTSRHILEFIGGSASVKVNPAELSALLGVEKIRMG